MTRTSSDWRESGRKSVSNTVEEIHDSLREQTDDIGRLAADLKTMANADDPDVDEIETVIDTLCAELRELAHTSFGLAADVKHLRRGSATRQLRGKEPLGYSKPDGGATHDAVYGAAAQGKAWARDLSWPLQLSEWDSEKAPRAPNGDYKPLTVEGTRKYERRIGGRPVVVVVDDRDTDPPI